MLKYWLRSEIQEISDSSPAPYPPDPAYLLTGSTLSADFTSVRFGRKKTVVAPLLLAALCAAANVVLSMDFDGKGGETGDTHDQTTCK